MPVLDVTIVGKAYLPEVGGGPIIPPGSPPGIWGPNDPRPTPPIVIPPDAIAPGVPTHPIYIPVYPAHPIVIPPNAIGPGVPTHPIVLPPFVPAHPIVIPPGAIDGTHPEHPIYIPPTIWGPGDPRPTPPIAQPPDMKADWVFSPVYGWVIDPSPEGGKPVPPGNAETPAPTPTGGRRS